jgi:lipid-binding SYLF domain-containing protein
MSDRFMRTWIEDGSIGFQVGSSSTDLIMLVMNERGANELLASKFTP